MNVHFGTYVFPKRFTSVYFLILCSHSVADPGFPKVCANLSFCKIIAENYTRIKEFRLGAYVPSAPSWIRHCLTACTLWHRISFCRSTIGLPPVCQKLSNRIFAICLETYSVKLSYKQAVLLPSLLNHGNHHLQSVLLSVDMYCSIDALIQSISMKP